MQRPKYFVGIDIASETFVAAAGDEPWQLRVKPQQFENELDSFPKFLVWLQEHGLEREKTVLCMEATGVYGEALAYFLHANGYHLAVEPPLKVKRALIGACFQSLVHDQQITMKEAEFFRLLVYAIDCPLPPWVKI